MDYKGLQAHILQSFAPNFQKTDLSRARLGAWSWTICLEEIYTPYRGGCAVLWHTAGGDEGRHLHQPAATKDGVFGAFCYSFVTRAVFRVVFRTLEDARRRPQKDALPDGGGRLHREGRPRPGGSSAALAEALAPEAGDPPRREARALHRDGAQPGRPEVKSERPRILLRGVNNPSRARADTFPRVHALGHRSISLYIHISKF